jgi:hypothetical protein
MHERAMREMTLSEYLRHSLMQRIAKDAEEEGIRIVAVRSKPRLVKSEVLPMRSAQTEGKEM